MCGIAGVFAYASAASSVDREELQAISEQMRARGPDGSGLWISPDDRVGLASRRLAIIDTSPRGAQPMPDAAEDLWIIFNGEIYNHRELRERLRRLGAVFRSTSDTEVLLEMYRQYGASMVELLRGMFAFVIWDSRKREMFVARDPYGIKPLYISDDGRTLRVASTVKALLAGGGVSAARDLAGTAGFWLTGSVPEPFTIHQSIRAVQAGTRFFVDANGRRDEKRFFSIAATLGHAAELPSIGQLVHPPVLMRELITESLVSHLVSDVPVGAFLSSGIDSSVLTALAAEQQVLQTVTLRFQEFRGGQADEAPLAERFARERGIAHTTRTVTRDEFLADLPKLFEAMDQPTIDGTNTWFVSKAAAELGLKVALSGLGGDELFGSYPSFRALPRIVAASRVPGMARLAAYASPNPKMKNLARYGKTWEGAWLIKRGLFLPDDLPALMGREAAEEGLRRLDILALIRSAIDPDPGTPFSRVAALEASLYMRNQLLRDTDWASMAHSLEVRTPLVDATLLRQLAPLLLIEKRTSKQHFAASPIPPLPQYLGARRKTGFSIPLSQWASLESDGTSTRMRSWARRVWEHWS